MGVGFDTGFDLSATFSEFSGGHYLLISQDEVKIEVYRRDSSWQTEVLKENDSLQLESVDFVCSVQQLYESVSR